MSDLDTKAKRADAMESALASLLHGSGDVVTVYDILSAAEEAYPNCPFCSAVMQGAELSQDNVKAACPKHRQQYGKILEKMGQ